MIALALVTVLALAAVGALVFITVHSRVAPGPSLAGRMIEVHTRRPDDQTIRGVLVAQHADRWTMIEAVYRHSSGDQPIADPVVHVPAANVAWYSEPAAKS